MRNVFLELFGKMQHMQQHSNGALTGGFISVPRSNGGSASKGTNEDDCENSGDCTGADNKRGCSNTGKCIKIAFTHTQRSSDSYRRL